MLNIFFSVQFNSTKLNQLQLYNYIKIFKTKNKNKNFGLNNNKK